MPRKIVSWECDTCGKNYGYGGYEAARSCEMDHMVAEAVAKTKIDIRNAFRLKKS